MTDELDPQPADQATDPQPDQPADPQPSGDAEPRDGHSTDPAAVDAATDSDATPDRDGNDGDGNDRDGDDGDGDDGDGNDGDGDDEEDKVETRYRVGIAITLAMLAVLGAGIAILQGNAGGSESATARQATRLATEAQAARVIEVGARNAKDKIGVEIDTLSLRPGYNLSAEAAAEAGVLVDPSQGDQRLAESKARLEGLLDPVEDRDVLFDLAVRSRELALEQAAVVHERVTWNARASQYETVITVLGVALFLIGFTAVVSRKLRPPLALPGILLALYCAGWATHIYLKDIPDVPRSAVAATAVGEALLSNDRVDESVTAFDEAIAEDDTYLPAWQGRSLAQAVQANPDILNTFAITDTDSDTFDSAVDDALQALELGGKEDVTSVTVAGMLALVSGDLDNAQKALTRAVELNSLTPGIQFTLSAVEAARGDADAALEWRRSAVDLLGPAEESDLNRALAANYYTMLEFVRGLEGTDTELIDKLLVDTISGESALATGKEMTGEAPDDARLTVPSAHFVDDETTVDLFVTGVPDTATITILGYELPAEGASFIQARELFYVGDNIDRKPLTIKTPRACDPIEYRFDLYVEGVPVDSVTTPGTTATC